MIDNHFTVIIPAYNCEKWVTKNLNSVIQQKYENYEIVYVDDCSNDNTEKLKNLKKKNIFFLELPIKELHA